MLKSRACFLNERKVSEPKMNEQELWNTSNSPELAPTLRLGELRPLSDSRRKPHLLPFEGRRPATVPARGCDCGYHARAL